MAKFIEVEGKTIAEAIQKGLTELELSLEDVTREVISQPKNGFFGFGTTKAKVRLTVIEKEEVKAPKTVKKETKEEVKAPKTVKKETKEEVKTPKIVKKETKEEVKTPKIQKEEKIVENSAIKSPKIEENIEIIEPKYKGILNQDELKAKDFIDGLLEKMGIEGSCEIIDEESDEISINITGNNLGNAIGRRGDTLDSIQYIANLVMRNGQEESPRIKLDCENYRIKRHQTLEKLALKMGHKVLKNKKNMTLEPMNPYERRVIHEVLQNFRGVSTYSTGKEPNRRVVIGYGEKK